MGSPIISTLRRIHPTSQLRPIYSRSILILTSQLLIDLFSYIWYHSERTSPIIASSPANLKIIDFTLIMNLTLIQSLILLSPTFFLKNLYTNNFLACVTPLKYETPFYSHVVQQIQLLYQILIFGFLGRSRIDKIIWLNNMIYVLYAYIIIFHWCMNINLLIENITFKIFRFSY